MSDGPRNSHGDVTAEYLAFHEGAAWVDDAAEILWVDGDDAISFLDGQLSQDVAGSPPGTVARSLLLEPRGKLVASLWMLRGERSVGLRCDRGVGQRVNETLERFKFRVAATIGQPEPTGELWGPLGSDVLEALGLPVPGPGAWVRSDGPTVGHLAGPLPRFLVAGMDGGRVTAAGAVHAGTLAATAVRIECGEPVTGQDVDESTIPQESGLVPDAVSFTKGCFVGQELVARIDARGRVNRHLRGLVVTENVIPPVGASLSVDGSPVGELTSVGESLKVRAPVALGMVRREVEIGDTVTVEWDGGSTVAEVRALPLIGAPPTP